MEWLSILREGLLGASGTPFMTGGQAHGSGIYLGQTSVISMAYTGTGTRWRNSAFPPGFVLVGLCEILHKPPEAKTGSIFVIQGAERVLVRALLVLVPGQARPISAAELGRRVAALPVYQQLHGLGPFRPK